MRIRHRGLLAPALLASALTLSACGSSSSGGGVVSLAGGSATAAPSPTASGAAEQDALKYVECLRGQGLDIPDPTVDAKGNLTFGRPPGGTGSGGGAGGGGGGGFDRDKFTAAQKVCGPLPASLTNSFTGGNQAQFQDNLLKFAKCMRGQGIDMADPDFSKGMNPSTLFGDLDQNDPKVIAAGKVCQKYFTGTGSGTS
jgi:hypothetical protein